ncbi:MAG: HEAT repeat domain-containing protein [Phycisphaerales bacterium]|nr:HEAT repeat domain-containing protein [Phycisphaerales bacterium]
MAGFLLMVVVAATGPIRAQTLPTTAPLPDPHTMLQREMDQLAAQLADDSITQTERDEAARRLVLRHTEAANTILNRILQAAANRPGQLAVAKALAIDPAPDPQFINPLFALIGVDRPMTEAAIQALSAFKDNTEVFSRLASLATSSPQRETRLAAIKALGTSIEKRAAEVLVNLLADANEPSPIHNAAADALATMTGIETIGRDPARWQQWWTDNHDLTETQWRVNLLDNRAVRFDQLQYRLGQMRDEMQSLLFSQYQAMPDAQRPEVLLRYLRSAEPAIRAVGARIVYNDKLNNRAIPAPIKQQLRQMVGDSAAEVRMEVARALRVINDPESLEPLLAQLAQEPDEQVRAEIAQALTPIGDIRAIDPLLQLLRDPSPKVAEAAARALRELGPLARDKNPELASHIAASLRQVVETRTNPTDQSLRESCVEAMVVLRDPSLRDLFYKLLRPQESPTIRRAALDGLGEYRDPKVVDRIVQVLLNDRDEAVRLAAVRALEKCATFEIAPTLYQQLDPGNETSAKVRDAVWNLLQLLFPEAPKEALPEWAQRFNDQPERRLIILKALAEKQLKDKDEEPLAYTRENIGQVYMRLNQPAEAAAYFKLALDFWRSRQDKGMVTQGLIRQTLEALLRSRQYEPAIEFAAPLIKEDPTYQEIIGAQIRAETNNLLQENEYAEVIKLVAEADKMTPPLDARYTSVLHSLADQARQKLAERQKSPATTSPRSDSHAPMDLVEG